MRKLLPQSGRGDMGDASDPESVCRFQLDSDRWEVVFIRVHYETISGSTPDDADLSIKVDRRDTAGLHRYLLAKVAGVGTGDGGQPDVNLRVMPEEVEHWRFCRHNQIVLEWPNPDSGNVRWIAEVELRSVSETT